MATLGHRRVLVQLYNPNQTVLTKNLRIQCATIDNNTPVGTRWINVIDLLGLFYNEVKFSK